MERNRIKPELSKKNKYWIDKRRYYELKYFCLQYPLWKSAYELLDGFTLYSYDLTSVKRSNLPGDPTGQRVKERSIYFERMELVKQAAFATDTDLSDYIIKAVTEDLSFEYLKTQLNIPCSRDTYYDRYRRFFWILNNIKD